MKKSSRTRRICGIALLAGSVFLLLLVGAFVLISLRIGTDVGAISGTAMEQHTGDAVEALMALVEDTGTSLRDRNRAVWALGQLGDRRALPTLREYYSGESCDHQRALCQRELAKAIELLEGGVNATALIWR